MAKPLYDYEHQQDRIEWNTRLEAGGPIMCRRCGQPIYCDRQRRLNRDHRKFDLGHPEPGLPGKAPEHACCNRAAGARKGNAQYRPEPSMEWW